MRNKFLICMVQFAVIPAMLFTVSCAKKTATTDASLIQAGRPDTQPDTKGEAVSQEAVKPKEGDKQVGLENEGFQEQGRREMALAGIETQEENAPRSAEIQRKIFLGELVLFEYDSSVLTAEARERLIKKAQWLQDHKGVKIVIEGHCDERGSTEYNLALGERRAEATRAFLTDMGISASRIKTISFGKERPFVKGHYESAWSLNRRAHFVIDKTSRS
jgi:peptidoglycan-associated lipoprotein